MENQFHYVLEEACMRILQRNDPHWFKARFNQDDFEE